MGKRNRVTVGLRWAGWFGLVCCLAGFVIQPIGAGPAPGTTRVQKVGSVLRITWKTGKGPYGIYRSYRPQDLARPAWLTGLTRDLFYEEPLGDGANETRFYLVADPLPCNSDSDCTNNDPCDGTESCDLKQRRCQHGIPKYCYDDNPCTWDSCDHQTGECLFVEKSCSDGIACTIDRCDPDNGCQSEVDPLYGIGRPMSLSGRALAQFPYFEYANVFNKGTLVQLAIDPGRYPWIAGKTCDLYILAPHTAAEWCENRHLIDVRGTPDRVTFTLAGIRDNTFTLAGSSQLISEAGTDLGAGYDLAVDCNLNGILDPDEPADGISDEAGFFIARDITKPGPLAVTQFDDIGPEPNHCSGGGLDDMRIYYPSVIKDPGNSQTFPLVVISHGNGHCYDWYDFLGQHLASFGYIVMAHDNDTGPGIETASTTTLHFTDKILGQQGTLGGGVLNGHIDGHRIAWLGHSRGGEGVARAYDRLVDEAYQPKNYTSADIVVISSIAPTDFLGTVQSNPHSVPYHLLYGSADGDVCGCPDNTVAQSFGLYERATGARQSTYVHGADHNDFNCCGFEDFDGPNPPLGRPEAQQVQKAVQLAVVKHYLDHSRAAKDFLARSWDEFRPLGVKPETIVVNEFRVRPAYRRLVVDDYQTGEALNKSSSGGDVGGTVVQLFEGRETEVDGSFEWTGTEPMNGMTRGQYNDTGRGGVFEFSPPGEKYYEFHVIDGQQDFTGVPFLSFRAAQMTRHPLTVAELENLTFTVTLIDKAGVRSSINIGALGYALHDPYQREGYGSGAGWQNEFQTIRLRLTDFLNEGSAIDLSDIHAIRFEFGGSCGSSQGRIGIDDIELVQE